MKPAKILYLLADDEIKAKVRELIGPERHAMILAKAALQDGQETPDTEVVAKLFKVGKRAAQKKTKKNLPKTRQ
jgi:hypothetical protein